MARKPKKPSGHRVKFDESKHRRERTGRFGDKPGAGDDAPQKPEASATDRRDLKTMGVTARDEIVVLSDRARTYRDGQTVGEFIDGHPKGRKQALRKLASDRKRGLIGFRDPPLSAGDKERAERAMKEFLEGGTFSDEDYALLVRTGKLREQTALDAELRGALPAPPRKPWSGTAQLRDISGDGISISPRVVKTGLFRDDEQVREITAHLTAGVPAQERLTVQWRASADGTEITMQSWSRRGAVVDRTFFQDADGKWSVEHSYFSLPERYQGGGNAKRMLRSSVEAYDRIGVQRVEVHANIDVGGYSWARLGFAPNDPAQIRKNVEAGLIDFQTDVTTSQRAALRLIVENSPDDSLMYDLSRLTSQGTKQSLGKSLLLNSDWYGHLDLSNPAHRRRLDGNFR